MDVDESVQPLMACLVSVSATLLAYVAAVRGQSTEAVLGRLGEEGCSKGWVAGDDSNQRHPSVGRVCSAARRPSSDVGLERVQRRGE